MQTFTSSHVHTCNQAVCFYRYIVSARFLFPLCVFSGFFLAWLIFNLFFFVAGCFFSLFSKDRSLAKCFLFYDFLLRVFLSKIFPSYPLLLILELWLSLVPKIGREQLNFSKNLRECIVIFLFLFTFANFNPFSPFKRMKYFSEIIGF